MNTDTAPPANAAEETAPEASANVAANENANLEGEFEFCVAVLFCCA